MSWYFSAFKLLVGIYFQLDHYSTLIQLDFQLLVRAVDVDDNDNDDILDDVFINMILEVNAGYTALEESSESFLKKNGILPFSLMNFLSLFSRKRMKPSLMSLLLAQKDVRI